MIRSKKYTLSRLLLVKRKWTEETKDIKNMLTNIKGKLTDNVDIFFS